MSEIRTTPILDCPEEVLVKIFSYLNATSLCQLLKTCSYFKSIIESKSSLWTCIDTREGNNSNEKTKYFMNKVNSETTHICIRGNKEGYGEIPENFSNTISALKNLKIIALENQKFSGSKVRLKDFPECLEELSVKNSLIKRSRYFFQDSDKNMQNLRVLIVDGCRWMHTTYFKWITKYENLEILSAANCMNSQFFVTRLWNKYDPKNLKVVDFRFSIISSMVDMTVAWQPLHALYFQNVSSSESDYGVKIPYKIGPIYENIEMWSDFECELDGDTFETYFWQLLGADKVDEMPVSYLYKDPYSECTCRYKEREKEEKSGSSDNKSTPNCANITENTYTAFHKEAMEIDWDDASNDHIQEGYETYHDEYLFDDNFDKEPPKKLALQRVSFRGFEEINDEQLSGIKKIELEVLDLTGTLVTKKGIEDFLACNPNCRVVHPLYCICKPRCPF